MSPGSRLLPRLARLSLFWVSLGVCALSAAPTPTPAPGAKPAKPAPAAKATPAPPAVPIDGFQVPILPANIAPTASIRTAPANVAGQPRMAKGHPNTFWDQDDVDYFKNLLKTNKDLQIQFAALKARMDTRIATPPVVPPPEKGSDGNWKFIGEMYPPFPGVPADDNPVTRFRRYWVSDSDDVSDLGTVYALTGEAKYADYAKQILLGRAVMRSTAAGNVRLRSAMGLTTQLLEEALILDHYVRGYDLIYNLPSWTAEEHKKMHDDFVRPLCELLLYPGAPDIDQQGSFATQNNNRGLIGSVAVLASGYVTGDQELINAALYGMRTTLTKANQAGLTAMPPPKDWEAGTAENPSKGLLTQFYAERAIPGGMWVEGTPSYAFYALGSMIDGAEIAWHHGIDLYRHNNSIFKNMFDFPLLLAYPDLTYPGLNDAHRESLLGGTTSTIYEYGYRRYQDPRYLTMINTPAQREYLAALASGTPLDPDSKLKSARFIDMKRIGSVPPSILWDLDPSLGQTIPPSPSVNYPSVGFGILRTPAMDGGKPQSLVLSAGPAASHGHPDKLHIDLYALGELLMPSPGINFPYTNNPRIERWYHTTVAHNTLTVDEKPQDFSTDSRYKAPPRADQTVFAPAATVGLQRAWTCSVYPGVTMDRAVFMTSGYLADLFGAFSAEPHKYDLAWHVRGDVKSDLSFSPMTFDSKLNGYNTLTEVRGASVAADKAWSISSDREGHVARLHAAAGPATQAIVGDSGFWVDHTVGAPANRPTCPTILERREGAASTIFGNALDYSGSKDGFVKSVQQSGGLDKGYALLQVTTTAGTDLCFAAYKPGTYAAGPLQTDAAQAFVGMNGGQPAVMYLAGGKMLKAGAAAITRSAPGLAYVEKTADGSFIVGNPSPGEPVTVGVALPALAGLKAYAVDAEGKKGAALSLPAAGATISLPLKAGEKVMWAK